MSKAATIPAGQDEKTIEAMRACVDHVLDLLAVAKSAQAALCSSHAETASGIGPDVPFHGRKRAGRRSGYALPQPAGRWRYVRGALLMTEVREP